MRVTSLISGVWGRRNFTRRRPRVKDRLEGFEGLSDRTGPPRYQDQSYKYQGPGGSKFISWLQYYGLATDGLLDYADSDSDGGTTSYTDIMLQCVPQRRARDFHETLC